MLRALETGKPRHEETPWSFPQYPWPFLALPAVFMSCAAANQGVSSWWSPCRPAFIHIWPLLLLHPPPKMLFLYCFWSNPRSFMAQLKFYFLQGPCPALDLKRSSLSPALPRLSIFHCHHSLPCFVAALRQTVCFAAAHA